MSGSTSTSAIKVVGEGDQVGQFRHRYRGQDGPAVTGRSPATATPQAGCGHDEINRAALRDDENHLLANLPHGTGHAGDGQALRGVGALLQSHHASAPPWPLPAHTIEVHMHGGHQWAGPSRWAGGDVISSVRVAIHGVAAAGRCTRHGCNSNNPSPDSRTITIPVGTGRTQIHTSSTHSRCTCKGPKNRV